ncbi:MAG TPA: SHOCT domain-containing protein [Burkholderiales bacterium]|jgi:putative membrane protein
MRANLKSVRLSLPALLLSAPPFALAQATTPGGYWDWPGPWHMSGWGFWWIFPAMMMLLIFAACFLLMVRMPFGHRHSNDRDATDSALRILSERFAKGEISKDEFEEKRSILGSGS